MKAVVCEKLGSVDDLSLIDDWAVGPVGTGEVRVKMRAAALNFPDLLMLEGKYQVRPELPFVPGGEGVGIVVEVAADVTQFKPGDEVLYIGVTGAFCEELVTSMDNLLPMPPGLDAEQAAGVGIAYLTAYYALRNRACLDKGESLLVMGAGGGVGLAAVDVGRLMGARVVAAAGNAEKLEVAKQQGANELINYSEGDFREKLRNTFGKTGVDVIVDSVGGDFAESSLRTMAWKGRYLVVGFAAGKIPQFPAHLCLLKGCSVMGVSTGEFPVAEPDNYRKLVDDLWNHFAQGDLSPVVDSVYTLKDVRAAFSRMQNREAIGKIVITF